MVLQRGLSRFERVPSRKWQASLSTKVAEIGAEAGARWL
jgi:hypothetical protein